MMLWEKDGYLHRQDGPALIQFYESGQVKRELYYLNGVLQREGEPANILYFESGAVKAVAWHMRGLLHRCGGPAVILYGPEGDVWAELWFQYGLRHCETGPAVTSCSLVRYFFLRGQQLSEEDWQIRVAALEAQRDLLGITRVNLSV